MMRKTQSKKIQNTGTSIKNVHNNNQNSLLVKKYLEQKLETQGNKGRVIYDATNKSLIQFRVKEGIIAIIKDGKLSIFEMPMKKFNGSMPLEFHTMDVSSIKTQKATCCKRCNSWKQLANITRCSCGGYLVPRKRFSTGIVPLWDEQFLEIEFTRKDIRNAKKTERVLSSRSKRYIPTGITSKLAGISSTIPEEKSRMELLLIPKGDDVKQVQVRSVESCSLIFVATIKSQEKQYTDAQKTEILAECANEQHSNDKQFVSEMKQFIRGTTPNQAKSMMDSWNNNSMTSQRPSKKSKRKVNSLKNPKTNSSRNHTKADNGLQYFASSIPITKKELD